jgi:hypothetical protein
MNYKFKFSCGCIFPREVCERKWIKKDKTWNYICPKHPTEGVMEARISKCIKCNKEFIIQSKGQVPKMCYECNPSKRKKKPKKKEKSKVTIIPLSNPDIKANQDRSDCKHRINECLFDPKYALTHLPCKTCTRYEPEIDKPITFAYRGQSDWLDD